MTLFKYLYYKETGKIFQCFGGFVPSLETFLVDGDKNLLESEIEYDINNFYILNNSFVEIPKKPSEYHVFDWNTKSWNPKDDLASLNVKMKRNFLLADSDWTQTLNVPFSQEKQQEWAIYRQQLRDITFQSGYPYTVIWPTAPSN